MMVGLNTVGWNMNLNNIKQLAMPGVCVIYSNKNVFIINSGNMLSSIVQRIHTFDIVKDITPCSNTIFRSILYNKLYKKYKDRGYRILSHKPRKWSIKLSVKKYRVTLRPEAPDVYKVFIELKNTHSSYVLGVFDTRTEALEWKKKYLLKIEYVTCYNNLTREWYENSR
jgi:hypothetical protein